MDLHSSQEWLRVIWVTSICVLRHPLVEELENG
jgi:hypothetical protein